MSVCPRCGVMFTCDIIEGRSRCWCQNVEVKAHTPLYESEEDRCLCKACLTGDPTDGLSTLLNTKRQSNAE